MNLNFETISNIQQLDNGSAKKTKDAGSIYHWSSIRELSSTDSADASSIFHWV